MTEPSVARTRPRPGIEVIVIDRPPVNALPPDDWRLLRTLLAESEADESVRAVVLTGTTTAFCAGADIRSLIAGSPDDRSELMLTTVGECCRAVRELRVPVVAAIDGPAYGGGLELALACDIRVAGTDASFGASSVNMGLIASVASLTDGIGATRARRMLLSGQRVAAETALEWGLVTDLVDGHVLDETLELAEHLASKPPLAVEAIKGASNRYGTMSSADFDALVAELFADLSSSADHREAITAFVEKRPGSYSRR